MSDTPGDRLEARRPAGIILSGGPRSVSDPGAPACAARVFDAEVPVLGICYGMQLMTAALGGKVARAPQREYGHAQVQIASPIPLLRGLPAELRVWASHGDFVAAAPDGFEVTATSINAPWLQ